MTSRRTLLVVGVGLLCAVVGLVFYWRAQKVIAVFPPPGAAKDWACPGPQYSFVMADAAMPELVEKDDIYTVESNYYACHEIRKGDLVLYRFSDQKPPVVRVVRAVAGDAFHLKPTKEKNRWNLEVNGDLVKGARDEVLWFSSQGPHLLSQYEESFKGQLEGDLVILMSNTSPGFFDSTNFGVMSLKDILGKVSKGGDPNNLAVIKLQSK